MNDFRHMSWDEAREYASAPSVEFDVVYDDQTGPAWDVWRLTWPQREHDARQYLRQVDDSHEVYWYRDERDGRLYGMPHIDLVRAENERLAAAWVRADARKAAIRRVNYAMGMLVFLTLICLGVAPDVIPWFWVTVPLIVLLYRKALGVQPKARYARLTETRFDVFESDQEIHDRRVRMLANVLTLGFAIFVIWLFRRH